MANEGSRICFVIAPIGEPDSDVRKRSDQILKHIIEPAAKTCGYEKTIRADQISKPGIITTQIIQHIIEDAVVVADLTDSNPNVFYELAIRHALRKPYIQIIQKGERIPFDVAAVRTIEVDHKDLDSAEATKNEIISQMQSMQGEEIEADSPISTAVDLSILRQSGNFEHRQLASALSTLAELRSRQEEILDVVREVVHSRQVVATRPTGFFTFTPYPPFEPPSQEDLERAKKVEEAIANLSAAATGTHLSAAGLVTNPPLTQGRTVIHSLTLPKKEES